MNSNRNHSLSSQNQKFVTEMDVAQEEKQVSAMSNRTPIFNEPILFRRLETLSTSLDYPPQPILSARANTILKEYHH